VERPTFGPGETIRVELDLPPGLYKIQCYVANHSDIGMETFLEVRSDAPKVRQEASGGNAVTIRGFAFDPAAISVAVGGEVTWTNADPAPHTVAADDGSFDSGPKDPGGTFSATFDQPGTIPYHCEIHPTMKGTITVAA
jgi:plastocyanin